MFSSLQLTLHLAGAATWVGAQTYQYVENPRSRRVVSVVGWSGFALTVGTGMIAAFSSAAGQLDFSQQLLLLAKILLAALSAVAGVFGLLASGRGYRRSALGLSVGCAVGAAVLGWVLAG